MACKAHRPWGESKQARQRRVAKRLMELPVVGAARPQFLLPLRKGEELSIVGMLDVRVVRGSAEVWGSVLLPSLKFLRIAAPPWSALPRLRATKQSKSADAAKGEREDVLQFLSDHGWPTVLCLSAVGSEDVDALKARLSTAPTQDRLRAHKVWHKLVEKFARLIPTATPLEPAVLLVMGGKGVGKSSCSRYFTNSLLRMTGEVCFLETDIGQPEIGPPGLVSLHRIRKPLLEPPHAAQHSHECLANFFAGGATPAEQPILYLKAVRAAFQAYADIAAAGSDAPVPPLVVNSHGWAVGFGLELVRTILEVVRAQLIVRILGTRRRKRAATSEASGGGEEEAPPAPRKRPRQLRYGPVALGLRDAANTATAEKVSTVLVEIDSMVPDVPAGKEGAQSPAAAQALHASSLRWLRLAGYFRPDLDPCKPPEGMAAREFFAPLKRGRLPLASLRFGLIQGELPPEEVEAAFTGMVVALCALGPAGSERDGDAAPAEEEAKAEASLPRVVDLRDVAAPRCIALAFVHSFDPARGEVTFFTPAAEAALADVDAVLRGDIAWVPYSVQGSNVTVGPTLEDSMVSPLQPYCASWTLAGLGTGSRAPSSRQMLPRRRFEKAGD